MRLLRTILFVLMPFCSALGESSALKLKIPSNSLSNDVINVVEKVLMCAEKNKLVHNHILTVIDYSLPSSKKRLWVFDLNQQKQLYHTYVSHGVKSGLKNTEYFSNTNKSMASSLGVFSTDFSYEGRYGLAVKLNGHEKGFNHNAYDRFIVMHPAWYVTEAFIQKYGRLGRSWGCPAVSYDLIEPIINTIKDGSLMVVYYPNDKWLSKSDFITCDELSVVASITDMQKMPESAKAETRDSVIYADKNNNKKFEDDIDPVLVMSADNYRVIFKKSPPLSRMLRRQFNNSEFIVLNIEELKLLDINNDQVINESDVSAQELIDFFIAEVKNIDGFWATEFKSIKSKDDNNIHLNGESSSLISTDEFIRWLGL